MSDMALLLFKSVYSSAAAAAAAAAAADTTLHVKMVCRLCCLLQRAECMLVDVAPVGDAGAAENVLKMSKSASLAVCSNLLYTYHTRTTLSSFLMHAPHALSTFLPSPCTCSELIFT
jgi:hypothetical protein